MSKKNKKSNAKIQKAMDGQEAVKKEKVKVKKEKVVKEPKVTRVDITCIDCGAIRNIATQDKHQVKRCKDCQAVYAKKRRAEYKREYNAKKKAEATK